jgi:hypothetical protein
MIYVMPSSPVVTFGHRCFFMTSTMGNRRMSALHSLRNNHYGWKWHQFYSSRPHQDATSIVPHLDYTPPQIHEPDSCWSYLVAMCTRNRVRRCIVVTGVVGVSHLYVVLTWCLLFMIYLLNIFCTDFTFHLKFSLTFHMHNRAEPEDASWLQGWLEFLIYMLYSLDVYYLWSIY